MKAKIRRKKTYRSVMDSICANNNYRSFSRKFNAALFDIEKKLPEKDRELINEVIYYRGMLEITITEHLLSFGRI